MLPTEPDQGSTNHSLENASTDSSGRPTGTDNYEVIEEQRRARAVANSDCHGNLICSVSAADSPQPETAKSTLSHAPGSSLNNQTKEADVQTDPPTADNINPSLDRATVDNRQEDMLGHASSGKLEQSQPPPSTGDRKSDDVEKRPPGYYNNERMRQVFNLEGAPESEIETDRLEQEEAIADFRFQNSPSDPIIDDDGGNSEAQNVDC